MVLVDLQKYYLNKSESGKRGACKRWNGANGESMAPIPSPIPIPKNNNNNFDIFWESLSNKRGSKKMAKVKYEKECKDQDPEQLAKIFNLSFVLLFLLCSSIIFLKSF